MDRQHNGTVKNKAATDVLVQRVYYGVLAAGLLAVVLFNLISALSSVPGFCGLCHQSSHAAWRTSSHARIKCTACHGGSSAFGVVAGRIDIAHMIPAQLTTMYKRPVTAVVPSANCVACHGDITTKTSKVGTIRVSHKEIVEGGYECTDCHSTVAHGKASVRKNITEMDKCLNCHNDATASSKCEACHVNGAILEVARARISGTWQTTHGSNWRKMHGMGDLSTCRACHSKLYCSRCHNTQLPHSMAWLTTHGPEVKKSPAARQKCLQCHQGSLCNTCHTLQMPHPARFLSAHSALVKKSGAEKCYNCHLKESCTKCHAYHIHPGIPKAKVKLLREGAGLD